MGRSQGILSTLIQIERAARRAQAAQARAAVRSARQADRERRAQERSRIAGMREYKAEYVQSRLVDVEAQNRELAETNSALESVLAASLMKKASLDLDTLKQPLLGEPFRPGDMAKRLPSPQLAQYLPPPPGRLMRLLPGAKAKHELRMADARKRFDADVTAREVAERKRQEKLEQARQAHEEKAAENRRRLESQHAEIEDLKRGFAARSPDAVVAYFTLVLDRSEYSEGFDASTELKYEAEAKKLLVDMDLPLFDVVPKVASFKYVKSKDEVTESARSMKERRGLYASVIAQVALRTLHEIFSADMASQAVDTVLFNGYVNGIHPGTGQPTRACVVSVQASPDVFTSFDLRRVDPAACLSALHGVISKSPEELMPVEAVREMGVVVDPRFTKKRQT